MSRPVFVLLVCSFTLSATGESSPAGIGVHIWTIDTDPDVEKLLEKTESGAGIRSCETVAVNGEEILSRLGEIAGDKVLLEQTPVRVWLYSPVPTTFYGLDGKVSAVDGRKYVRYTGMSRSRPASLFSIRIGPDGTARGALNLAGREYKLVVSNKPPTHFLCSTYPVDFD